MAQYDLIPPTSPLLISLTITVALGYFNVIDALTVEEGVHRGDGGVVALGIPNHVGVKHLCIDEDTQR
ncbi:hypothetical protein [Halorussus salinisoli]|uniref:hypothetical protein n=1 Tax=Halorussus salinisoli TaxID=2558242 RepID=UPI0010C21C6D|nr:hypothetical protein [Halorussus salinisoli]